MFESIAKFFKRFKKSEKEDSKSTAKERLHLVLAQDRANISADFLEMMKQEILEVIKKYIDIDEKAIDVRLTNKESEDGGVGAPALYANIPIITIKNEARKLEGTAIKEKEEKRKKREQEVEKSTIETEERKDTKEEVKKEQEQEQSKQDDTANDNTAKEATETIDCEKEQIDTKTENEKLEEKITEKKENKNEEKVESEKEGEKSKVESVPKNLVNNNVNEVADEKKNT